MRRFGFTPVTTPAEGELSAYLVTDGVTAQVFRVARTAAGWAASKGEIETAPCSARETACYFMAERLAEAESG